MAAITRHHNWQSYNLAIPKINSNIVELNKLLDSDPAQGSIGRKYIALSEKKLKELELTVTLNKAGKSKEALEPVVSGAGKEIMDELRHEAEDVNQAEDQLLQKRISFLNTIRSYQEFIIFFSLIFSLTLLAVIYLFLRLKLIKPLSSLVIEINRVANNSASQVIQLTKNLSQQSSSIAETTATAGEVMTSAALANEDANVVSKIAETAKLTATEEMERAKISKTESETLSLAMSDLSDTISVLASRIDQIGEISKLVHGISNQTNILALNASVEAARSGQYGKGFSVIAQEIRALSIQSLTEAAKTAENITEIQKLTNKMVFLAEASTQKSLKTAQNSYQAELAFEKLGLSIDEVSIKAKQVALNSTQQTTALAQVGGAMKTLKEGSKDIISSSTIAEVNVKNLLNIANVLKKIS